MVEENHARRRKFLKTVGASALFSAGLTSVASAEKKDEEEIDTDFDPDTQNEVYEFARQMNKIPESKARQILSSLKDAQKQAYGDAMKPVTYETELNEQADASQFQTLDADARVFTVSTTAKSPVGLVAYTYEVTVNFSWDANHDEITSITAEAGAAQTGVPWRYRGEDTDIVVNNGSSGYVKQTGNFGMCLYVPVCTIVDERNPTISLRVYPGGEVEILTKDNDN